MNFINNLLIKRKLLLLISLPLLAMLFFSITENLSIYKEINKTEKIKVEILFGKTISELLHETQKERGLSAGFLGSEGKKFVTELPVQRELTDAKYKLFLDAKENMNNSFHSDLLKENIEIVIKKLENINDIRKKVDALSIKLDDAISFYTDSNTILLKSVIILSKLTDNTFISQKIMAYANFLLSKERAGIERAIGTNTLTRDSFAKDMRDKISKLIAEQNSYIESFKYYASDDSIKFYENTVKGNEIDEVNRMRITFIDAVEKQKIIASIGEYIGYGGIIHNFKNYLLRGNIEYKNNVNEQYAQLSKLLNEYKKYPNLKPKELELISDIENTFAKYHDNLNIITKAYLENEDIKKVDKIVRVDDYPTMVALYKLGINLFGDDPEYWFSQITKKINLLKEVDDHLSLELIEDVNKIKAALYSTFITTLIITITALIIVLLLATYISRNIISSLDVFKNGLEDFFKYTLRQNDTINLLDIKGKDEFAQMSENINKQIESTSQLIEQDKKVVAEIDDVMKKVKNGFFCYGIKSHGATQEVETLRTNINEMLMDTKIKFDKINKLLDAYASGNYKFTLSEKDINEMGGDMGSLVTSTILLGSISLN